jgi:hypothetical protein
MHKNMHGVCRPEETRDAPRDDHKLRGNVHGPALDGAGAAERAARDHLSSCNTLFSFYTIIGLLYKKHVSFICNMTATLFDVIVHTSDNAMMCICLNLHKFYAT